MFDKVYGFKEDKCKVPIGTIIHHYNNSASKFPI